MEVAYILLQNLAGLRGGGLIIELLAMSVSLKTKDDKEMFRQTAR